MDDGLNKEHSARAVAARRKNNWTQEEEEGRDKSTARTWKAREEDEGKQQREGSEAVGERT